MTQQKIAIHAAAGPFLDYAVMLAEREMGVAVSKPLFVLADKPDVQRKWYSPSMDPAQCWPIIERIRPMLRHDFTSHQCLAQITMHDGSPSPLTVIGSGPTYLIAFCRAYANAVLGNDFESPFKE